MQVAIKGCSVVSPFLSQCCNCRGITPEVKEQLLAAVAKNRDKILKAFRLGDQSDTGVLSSKRFFAC